MAQNLVVFTDDPSGDQLLDDKLTPLQQNIYSTHAGNSRPSYAVAKMLWIDDTTTPWVLKCFDGTDDISIGTINATTNIFTPSGILLNNLAASSDPTTGDDSGDGYSIGSVWLNTTSDKWFMCLDNAVGAAVWKQTVDLNSTQTLTNKTLTSPTINSGSFNNINVTSSTVPANGIYLPGTNQLGFSTDTTHRGRIDSTGTILWGKTSANFNAAGVEAFPAGALNLTASGACPLFIHRLTNDGNLVEFHQAGTLEGAISVSGTTVTYGSFCGSHWSQMEGEILPGTVLDSTDELCEWKVGVYLDQNGVEQRFDYYGDLPIGSTYDRDITYVVTSDLQAEDAKNAGKKRKEPKEEERTYAATVRILEAENTRLPKAKVSDKVGSRAVYGVFMGRDSVGDIMVASLGAYVVRIRAGEKPSVGDYLQSAGDGCAMVQPDDVMRSSTIAKVTGSKPIETYSDGSFLLPATLHCG